jgi:hypothetical protein
MAFTLETPIYFWIDIHVKEKYYNVYATQDSLPAPELIAVSCGFRNSATAFLSYMGIHANDLQPSVRNSITIMNYGFVDSVGSYTPGPLASIEKIPRKFFGAKGVFPNPVTAFSRVNYQITEPAAVQLTVYDGHGQKMKYLENAHNLPGEYFFEINGKAFQSGLYFYKIMSGKHSAIGTIFVN